MPEIRYEITEVREVVAGHAFDLRVLDGFERQTARLYAQLRGAADPDLAADLCPMFGVLWDAARALAATVAADPDLPGARVLELGCGLALPSLVAARRGADVVASDLHPHAGAFLAQNLARNDLVGRVRYRPFDWRADAPPDVPEAGFDRVLASDVLFERALPPLAARTFARFLRPGGVGWLTDPGRPWLDAFEAEAVRCGLAVTVDVVPSGEDAAFLVTLRRASA